MPRIKEGDELGELIKTTSIYNATLDGVNYEVWIVTNNITSQYGNKSTYIGEVFMSEEVGPMSQGDELNKIIDKLEQLIWWVDF